MVSVPLHSRRWLWPALAAILAIIAYAPAIGNGFVDLDDQALLIDNTAYRGLGPRQIVWAFSTTLFGHYQPLTWLSFTIDHELFGLDPAAFHATNLVLHAIATALVCVLAARLVGIARGHDDLQGRVAAFAAAVFWAVHPLRAESVAWVTERRDVLSTVFLLAAALAYLRAVEVVGPRSLARHAIAFSLLAFSLLSKAWGMTFFAVLLILDVYPLARFDSRHRPLRCAALLALEKAPYALLGVVAALVAAFAQRSAPGAVRTLTDWTIADRVGQAIYGITFYIEKAFSPSGLVPLVELPSSGQLWDSAGLYVRSGVLLAFVGVAIALRRRAPVVAVALAVYAVLLLPVLGILQSGDQLVADRYAYVAGIPISIALGSAVLLIPAGALSGSGQRRLALLVAVGCLLSISLIVLSWSQARVWRSPLSLWSHAVAAGAPGSAVHVNLALALAQANRPAEAIERLRVAVAINPRDGRGWYTLGTYQRRVREFAEAEAALRHATSHLPQAYIAHTALGNLLFNDLNRREEGLAAYRAAIADLHTQRADSYSGRQLSGVPYLALGAALRKTGDLAAAREAFTGALNYPDSRDEARAQLNALPIVVPQFPAAPTSPNAPSSTTVPRPPDR
ncbi:MAG: hypothetical protein ACKVW3_08830 [Phycisphaerales bacterium]